MDSQVGGTTPTHACAQRFCCARPRRQRAASGPGARSLRKPPASTPNSPTNSTESGNFRHCGLCCTLCKGRRVRGVGVTANHKVLNACLAERPKQGETQAADTTNYDIHVRAPSRGGHWRPSAGDTPPDATAETDPIRSSRLQGAALGCSPSVRHGVSATARCHPAPRASHALPRSERG